jgi:hypothetical protein
MNGNSYQKLQLESGAAGLSCLLSWEGALGCSPGQHAITCRATSAASPLSSAVSLALCSDFFYVSVL